MAIRSLCGLALLGYLSLGHQSIQLNKVKALLAKFIVTIFLNFHLIEGSWAARWRMLIRILSVRCKNIEAYATPPSTCTQRKKDWKETCQNTYSCGLWVAGLSFILFTYIDFSVLVRIFEVGHYRLDSHGKWVSYSKGIGEHSAKRLSAKFRGIVTPEVLIHEVTLWWPIST